MASAWSEALNQLADRLILQEQEVQSLDPKPKLSTAATTNPAIDGARNEPVVQYHFGLSLLKRGV